MSTTMTTVTSGTTGPLLEAPLLGGAEFNTGSLTTEGLITYLGARLSSVDARIDETFKRQQGADRVRTALREISSQLNRLEERTNNPSESVDTPELVEYDVCNHIDAQIKAIDTVDPELANRLRSSLDGKTDGILNQIRTNHHQSTGSASYKGLAVTAAKELVGNINKDLDASSQLEMIQLQSLTSARQTAISLATNLIASLSESYRATVNNIK